MKRKNDSQGFTLIEVLIVQVFTLSSSATRLCV
ncbi:prepilin-type N-terminal cleavage/methylation domain-containing protein [Thermodesulfobacteriota bacterium]